ncbi:HAD-IB family hydrolase [Adlercreutzia sp. R21]|uniref:HAD family hydrolase n=1 Tax=Adlercreutzia wanghongyangiae TaxID=3111451 RepID=UPI002DBB13B4|nr:HAD-IB family hydrolase [Adlercreutzia sp. R21]MEC4183711.1 HAD-IB family hydrolase [Adlercreutzia sp. R21]
MPIVPKPSVLVPDEECGCGAAARLPEGICRVTPAALGAERLLPAQPVRDGSDKVQVAAFDFDGTCIRGNSPVLLVRHLARRRMLKPSVIARIMGWGACYKARLPQNESWVRGLVFRAFVGQPAAEVNRFLRDFYDRFIDERFRPDAEAAMLAHEEAGHAVVCVSATFEPIVAAAMQRRPIQYAIATRMKVDFQGNYTDKVEGLPIEGPQKVQVLSQFCDERFGEGRWELAWAYGDHHSDRALLAAAAHPCAVTPDRPLTRTANAEGYEILDWRQGRK